MSARVQYWSLPGTITVFAAIMVFLAGLTSHAYAAQYKNTNIYVYFYSSFENSERSNYAGGDVVVTDLGWTKVADVTMGGQRTGLADMGLLEEPPEFGFIWTQDRIFVPRAKGSGIANIHIYG
jgi:hypothetical protein